MAEVFGVPSASVKLVSGEKSSQKRVEISGMTTEGVVKKLEAACGRACK
jgi:uncharacterized protein YggU (UPF0235/DUF167 family)